MAAGLSKSRILAGLQCEKRLWLEVHRRELADYSPAAEARFAAGHRVGEVARALKGAGRLIGHDEALQAALAETSEALAGDDDVVLFEAAFAHEGVLVRADLLERAAGRLSVEEVKSSTEVKLQHVIDTAVQAWVMEGSGHRPDAVALTHIDSDFVYPGGGDYRGLFARSDVGREVAEPIVQVPAWVDRFRSILRGPEPERETGPHCDTPYGCPFKGYCSQGAPEYPVELLPHGARLAAQLKEEGYRDLREVPQARLSSEKHLRVWRATRNGCAEIDAAAARALSKLFYPRYYLDFETAQFAVPIWAGTRPYEQLPFQWSCHVEGRDGSLEHREFLEACGAPPMRAFAESLLAALGSAGPVIVYSSFESRVLRDLAERFPDLAQPLERARQRMFDLLPLVRQCYYHPAMMGSWSIKSVVPTLAPDLDYGALREIQDGQAAQIAYAEAIDARTTLARRAEIEARLLAYCAMDSMAMVRVVRALQALQKPLAIESSCA